MYIAVDSKGTKWLVLGRALSASKKRVVAARLATFQRWKTLLLAVDVVALLVILKWIALNYSPDKTALAPFPFIAALLVAIGGFMVRFEFAPEIKTITTEAVGAHLRLHLLLLALILMSAVIQASIFALHAFK